MTYRQKAATYFSSRGAGAALPLPVETPPAAGALFAGAGLPVGAAARPFGVDKASFSVAPGVSAR